MARYQIYHKVCLQCDKPLETTSTREKVHAACRQEFYKNYQHRNYRKQRMNASLYRRERKRYRIAEGPCEACGYAELTKRKGFYHADTQEVKDHFLCPNCLALWRCGLLEALTWKKITYVPAEV